MTNEELNTKLYERMFAEQERYRDWLLTLSPDEILHHAYEYTNREDILMAVEYDDFSDKQCLALLKSPTPLADIFREFEKQELGHMEDIRNTIKARANAVIRADFVKSQRDAR